ncbi:hypothetical protein ABPG72_009681 [Tetrahymena utriculariae]
MNSIYLIDQLRVLDSTINLQIQSYLKLNLTQIQIQKSLNFIKVNQNKAIQYLSKVSLQYNQSFIYFNDRILGEGQCCSRQIQLQGDINENKQEKVNTQDYLISQEKISNNHKNQNEKKVFNKFLELNGEISDPNIIKEFKEFYYKIIQNESHKNNIINSNQQVSAIKNILQNCLNKFKVEIIFNIQSYKAYVIQVIKIIFVYMLTTEQKDMKRMQIETIDILIQKFLDYLIENFQIF